MSNRRIHIFGASGSGTTTLGQSLAKDLKCAHFDADNYYWIKTDPPFTTKREITARLELLTRDLTDPNWVLSGSLVRWADQVLSTFTLAVFVYLEPKQRMERLRIRERERYGSRIDPGGDMHQLHLDFLKWAASYETPNMEIRSKAMHEAWIRTLSCNVLTIDGAISTTEQIRQVKSAIFGLSDNKRAESRPTT